MSEIGHEFSKEPEPQWEIFPAPESWELKVETRLGSTRVVPSDEDTMIVESASSSSYAGKIAESVSDVAETKVEMSAGVSYCVTAIPGRADM